MPPVRHAAAAADDGFPRALIQSAHASRSRTNHARRPFVNKRTKNQTMPAIVPGPGRQQQQRSARCDVNRPSALDPND